MTQVVLASHENAPSGECAAVVAVIAAPTRMTAIQALRAAGFPAHKHSLTEPKPEDRAAALTQPDVVLWRPWDAEPPYTYTRGT